MCFARAYGDENAETLVARSAEWRYLKVLQRPPEKWAAAEFDDSTWEKGKAGFGYGDSDDRTVLRDMEGNYASILIRCTFTVVDPSKVKQLYLYVNYDDAFIAHVNGNEVATGSAEHNPVTGGIRIASHEASGFEEFVIDTSKARLRQGENVIAIVGFNAGKESSDFSLDPFLRLTRKQGVAEENARSLFTLDEYKADLAEFRNRVLDQSSYLTRRNFDFEKAIADFESTLTEKTTPTDFIQGLRQITAQIGDCHAHVISPIPPRIAGFLPIRIADTKDGIVALRLYENRPLSEEHPYLDSLDGHSIKAWLEAAGKVVAYGSPQLRRRRALEEFVLFDELRNKLKVPRTSDVAIGLTDSEGKRTTVRARLTGQPTALLQVRLLGSRMLEGNIGYIRLPQMDERLADSVVKQIQDFRETDGLIIDVRDNGGGTYGIMRAIYPYFQKADAGPTVVNIAAYRLSAQFAEDHIAYRPTYRAGWNGWNAEDRNAIANALGQFTPVWQPPAEKFSEWHFMVLSRKRSGVESDYFYYDKPVVVISNAGSFSATDGFLSAFSLLPQVSIVGEPSGGGSGATRRFQLANTGTLVALSSMASFRPNGKTFDGYGVDVDFEAKPTLDDFLGKSDSVLDKAIEVIVTKRQKSNRPEEK
ncbi:MAG: hypothetical protein KDB27_03385 [Planctomycetales bacterium]|nr:hypothetical protein [Planctomycetales bacterium]